MIKEYVLRQDLKILDKQQEEAKEKNLVLISKTDNRCYGYYRLPCGHFSFLHYGSVRKARTNFACKDCLDIKLQEEASRVNLVYNKNVIVCGHDLRNYTLPCGHSRDIKAGAVRKGNVPCKECEQQKLIKEAESAGLILLDKPSRNSRRHYLLPCGHEKEILMESVRGKAFRCRICQDDHYAADAKAVGLVYQKDLKASHHDYRFYTLPCGCTKEIAIACVRKGSFECKNHSQRSINFTKPISVYLFKFTLPVGDVLKLGFARNVKGRKSRYGIAGTVEELLVKEFKAGQDAVSLERNLHDKYAADKLSKEVMSTYMTNGFTECYPMELLETLKAEIENYKGGEID